MLAVLNGGLREVVLIPTLGSVVGLMLSGILLAVLILLVVYLTLPWLNVRSCGGLVVLGLGWLAATLVFEFSLGWLSGKGTAEILGAYTFRGGNLWPAVLAVLVAAPWLAAQARGRR